jgi:hypothetical protein
VLESVNVSLSESSAEVTGGGGIGDTACPQSIEEGFVVATQFDVLKAGAVAQCVVSDVEDVIGLVIREMDFQEVETLVNGLGQPELVCEPVDGPDAAVNNGSVSLRNVVVDGATGEDGSGGRGVLGLIESPLDSVLACAKPGAEEGFHSKSSVWSGRVGCVYTHKSRKPPRISSFLGSAATDQPEITLDSGLEVRRRR